MRTIVKEIIRDLYEFEETIFYPGGGGQPCDTGMIKGDNYQAEVIEVKKQEGKILHRLQIGEGKIAKGDLITLIVNQDRRDKLTRMHTGEHIFFRALQMRCEDLKLEKIDLDIAESSLFVSGAVLTWDTIFSAEEDANRILREDRKSSERILSREEAAAIPELRMKADRIKEETVRVIQIEGHDLSACTGTHAESTGFVRDLLVTKFSQTQGFYEIRFSTDAHDLVFQMARAARKAASALGTDTLSLPELAKKAQEERDAYKEKYRQALQKLPVELRKETAGSHTLLIGEFEGFEKKKLTDVMNDNLKDSAIILLLNSEGDKTSTALAAAADVQVDVPKILSESLTTLGGKGGGRDRMAQGSIQKGKEKELIEEIKKRL